MKEAGKTFLGFIKKEIVLCAALFLGAVSMFWVPPDKAYAGYIDFRVLGILFALMVVMAGLQELGVFDRIARMMLKKADTTARLCFVMVFLCFFSAMFITNDVALITFVPFTLLLLKMAGKEELGVPLVVYETVAANMGSALTPIGNPQNLYLYTAFGMSLPEFMKVTLPIAGVSALLLLLCVWRIKKEPLEKAALLTGRKEEDQDRRKQAVLAGFYGLTFLLSLLTVLRLLPVWIPFTAALLGALLLRPKVLLRVDYSLLLTFVGFFVFVGNMGRIEAVSGFLAGLLAGRELLVAFFTSQIISNVPAAALLSGFTHNGAALLAGVNIGGLGTLIASMASLISYKFIVREMPEKRGKYFRYFTFANLFFAILLLPAMLLYLSWLQGI